MIIKGVLKKDDDGLYLEVAKKMYLKDYIVSVEQAEKLNKIIGKKITLEYENISPIGDKK
jgi:CO dehydrogenase/acetyl-CoA synthase epsilon subunit